MRYQQSQLDALHSFVKSAKSKSEVERARALLGLSKGKKRAEIAEVFEINIATLDGWQTKFKRVGVKGITDKGYPGNHHKLTKLQKAEIKQVLYAQNPRDLGLSDKRFWSTRLLRQFIQDKYGVTFKSEATYRKLFYSIGFSCHKPGKHNRNQRLKAVERFRVAVKKRSSKQEGWAVWYW